MKIVELRSGLGDLQRILDSFGAKKQAAELRSAIDALAEFDDLTLPELIRRIKTTSQPSPKKPKKTLNEVAVVECLSRLQSAVHLAEEFDAAVDSVLKDKRLKPLELNELARRFGGISPPKTSKGSVAAFLRERRLEMKRQGGLGATIDKMLGRSGS